jgi:hypothetical protein
MMDSDKTKVMNALGGKKGILDSGLPGVVFLIAFNIHHNLKFAIVAALVASAVLTIISLARKDSLQFVLSGFFGVAFCAFLAWKTGNPKDYYLPSLWKNSGFALIYLITNLAGWPILGLMLGPVLGENLAWRKVPERKRAYMMASWLWFGMFVLRLLIQYPLYKSGALNVLGTANIFLGLPLYFLTLWGSWFFIKAVPSVKPEAKTE